MSDKILKLFGQLEDAPEDRMVVRVLGHRVGTSGGWFHQGGWTVFAPEFVPEPGFAALWPEAPAVSADNGLLIDFYAAHIALVQHGKRGGPTAKDLPLVPWHAPLRVT